MKRTLIILTVMGVVCALAISIEAGSFRWLLGEWLAPLERMASLMGVRTESKVEIGGVYVAVEIVDTPKKRAQGLSGRDALGEREGMLFVFPDDGFHTFWMKDMNFSIDIVWISAEGVVVDVYSNVSPDTYPEYSFMPQEAARYVLELPAGWTASHNVKIGDWVGL